MIPSNSYPLGSKVENLLPYTYYLYFGKFYSFEDLPEPSKYYLERYCDVAIDEAGIVLKNRFQTEIGSLYVRNLLKNLKDYGCLHNQKMTLTETRIFLENLEKDYDAFKRYQTFKSASETMQYF